LKEFTSIFENDYMLFGLIIGSLIVAGLLGIYFGEWNP